MKNSRLRLAATLLLVLGVGLLAGWRFGTIHTELSRAYGMAWLMNEVWTERSGSKKHDLRIDLVYGGALSQIDELRSTVSGRIAEPFILRASPYAQEIYNLHIAPDASGGTRPTEENQSEQVGDGDA